MILLPIFACRRAKLLDSRKSIKRPMLVRSQYLTPLD